MTYNRIRVNCIASSRTGRTISTKLIEILDLQDYVVLVISLHSTSLAESDCFLTLTARIAFPLTLSQI